jgi:uncharacterized membrane protein
VWLLTATFAASWAWFAALALTRWNSGRSTAFDLGIFSQSAQSWARGELPESHIRGLELLGDHFSPITALFGAAWRVWPDPRSLLVLQALLLAGTLTAIVAIAAGRLGTRWAIAIGAVGALSGAVVSAVLFDVHEVAFAAPAMAAFAYGLMERRFRWCVAAAVVLVLVKEDLGLTVIAGGAAWWWIERRAGLRRALILAGIGVAGLVMAVVVVGGVNPSGGSGYLGYFGVGSSGSPLAPASEGLSIERLVPALMFTLATAVVGWRSPVALLAVPTLAWRAAASNPNYWSLSFHYDLVLWPVALLAFVDVARRLRWSWPSPLAITVAAAAAANVAIGVWHVADRAGPPEAVVRATDVRRDAQELARLIPDGSRVSAQNRLGAYLVADHDVYLFATGTAAPVDVAMFEVRTDRPREVPLCARRALLRTARTEPGWRAWTRGDFVLVAPPSRRPIVLDDCRPDPSPG